jgi:potassium-transporting ATPase KdpC subunit
MNPDNPPHIKSEASLAKQPILRPALTLLAMFTMLLGIGYPLAITGIAQVAFPHQANGSLLRVDGQVVGSTLIGQSFSGPEYFWPRPSAAGDGYDASASSGSNLGPTSKALAERTAADVARVQQSGVSGGIPTDLATASGSGLDPHISPAAANVQVPRVALARNLSMTEVQALVEANTQGPLFGAFGAPAVNVLKLNLALDRATGA